VAKGRREGEQGGGDEEAAEAAHQAEAGRRCEQLHAGDDIKVAEGIA